MVSRRGLHAAVTLVLLATADALLTRWGLANGWVYEANPIMARLFDANPTLAVGVCIGTSLLAAVAFCACWRLRVARLFMGGAVVFRVGVMVLHGVWVWQTFVTI